MLNVKPNERLTVYNGVDERSIPENVDLPSMCCIDVKADNGSSTDKEKDCPFEMLTDQVKLIHRSLILGEPLSKECLENITVSDAVLFNEWSPAGIEGILGKITTLAETINLDTIIKSQKEDREDSDLYTAILLIKLFIQLNFTGPDLVSEELKKFETIMSREEVNQALRACLEVEGIELESSVKAPALLLFARYFLSSLKTERSLWCVYLIWKFRIDYLHQKSLIRRSWYLSRRLKYYSDKYVTWFSLHDMSGIWTDVHATFLCEIAEMLIYYYDGILSERFLEEVMKLLKIAVDVSGKMGFRTKFQQTPTPQTIVTVTMLPDAKTNYTPKIEQNSFLANIPNCLPKSLVLDDDTRLERIRLVDDLVLEPHLAIHQVVLCCAMLLRQGFGGKTDLDRQEVEALINTLLDNPVSWSGRLASLVARCKLEKMDRRAIDRTLRQSEDLLKIISKQQEQNDALQRQYLFFGTGYPSKWDVKLLFGEVLLSLEHWKEALRIFTELDAFDQIVICYNMMSLRHKAEELVRNKIETEGKSPKLLVLMGDVTSDISFYQEAWTLSKGKSFFSQSRLGEHYFRRNEFLKASIHLKRAVDLAPLEYPCWLKLAWAGYKTEDYETAYQAYLRAANLEYDNFQVWNNLANCALKLGRKEYALRAYQLAVKCSYDEWRVWSNILVVASELRKLNDAIIAYHRILDLNKDYSDDAILDAIVNIAIEEENPDPIVLSHLQKLFGRITSLGTRSFMVWLLYGRLQTAYIRCDPEKCVDGLQKDSYKRGMLSYEKALALMRQNSDWKTDLTKLKNVVNCIVEVREKREAGRAALDEEINDSLKEYDMMLKLTATSVHENLKKLIESVPNPEKLTPVFEQMVNEMKKPFYT